MSIACDIQMATCDLSFEVSSDLSSWISIRPKLSRISHFPCRHPVKKSPAKPKLKEPASQITDFNPPISIMEGVLIFYISLQRNHFKFPFQFSLTFFQSHSLFRAPYLMSLLTMVCKGPAEVTTSVALGSDRDSVGMD